jgi:hypothetical protein
MKHLLTPRHAVLIAVVAVLLVAVLRDRTSSGADAEAPVSIKRSYLEASAVTAGVEAIIADRQRWESAHDKARIAWDEEMKAIIRAPSVNVAESSLRAFIEEAMGAAGLTLSVSSPLARQTPIEGEPLRVIGLTLDFDAPNPDALHTLLDRIENAPQPRMVVTDLEIRGPGRTGRDGLHVKLEVAAMAWIGAAEQVAGAIQNGADNG